MMHPAIDTAFEADLVAWPDDAIEVGRILGAWGVKGWVKVLPHSSEPKALFSSRRWYADPGTRLPSPPRRAEHPTLLRITHSREHGEWVVAKIDGSDTREAADAFKGFTVYVPRSSFPTAASDEFYWVDLIGLAVVNRQGERLGTVSDLIDTGAHCVLRIAAEAGQAAAAGEPVERLVPFVAAYVDEVNLAERRITVDWGLDY